MVYRMRQWLEWVFTGENEDAVPGERTMPALIKAFPDAAQLTFSDLSYWTALVSILPAAGFLLQYWPQLLDCSREHPPLTSPLCNSCYRRKVSNR